MMRSLIAPIASMRRRAWNGVSATLVLTVVGCATVPTPRQPSVSSDVQVAAPAVIPLAPPPSPVAAINAPSFVVEPPTVREALPVPLPSYAKRGKRLPPDGGAPGRAVLAYCQLFEIEKDPTSYYKRLQRRGQLPSKDEIAARSLQANEPLTVQQVVERDWALRRESYRTSPRRCKVLGGTVDGLTAHIVFDADINGKRQRGTATLALTAEKWRVRDHGDWGTPK